MNNYVYVFVVDWLHCVAFGCSEGSQPERTGLVIRRLPTQP